MAESAQERITRAFDLMRQDLLDEAEAEFRKVLAVSPLSVGALGGIGNVLRRRGDMSGALQTFGDAAQHDPDNVGINLEIGHLERERGQPDAAEAAYRRALAASPQHIGAHMALGQLARSRGDTSGALVAFEAVLQAEPDHLSANLQSASLLRDSGSIASAETRLRHVLQISPGHAGALIALGHLLLRDDRRLDEAEALFREAVAVAPGIGSFAGLGHTLRRRGDDAGALQAFEAGYALAPDNAGLALELAHALRRQGRLGEAEMAVRRILSSTADHVGALGLLAQILRERGARTEALELLSRLLMQDPENTVALLASAHLLGEEGRREEAEAAFRHVLERNPHHVGALIGLGYLLTRDDARLGEAEAAFRAAIDIEPNATGFGGLGNVLRSRGDPAGALEAYNAGLARDPRNIGIIMEKGHLLRRSGRLNDAEATFRQALEVAPDHVGATLAIAQLLRLHGDVAGARFKLEAVIRLDPSNISAIIERAYLMREMGDFDEAEAGFRNALEVDPKHVGATIALSQVLADRSRFETAERMLSEIADDINAQLARGYLARRRGDHRRALFFFQTVLRHQPEHPVALLETALGLCELGEPEQANQLLCSFRKAFPTDPRGWSFQAMVHRRMGAHDLAFADFQKAAAVQIPADPQLLVEMALEARSLGDAQASEDLLKNVLAKHPKHFQARIQMIEHVRLAEHHETARALSMQLICEFPGTIWPYIFAARAALELGHRELALDDLRRAKELFGEQPELIVAEFDACEYVRDWQAAQEILDGVSIELRHHFSVWTLHVRLAIILARFGIAERLLSASPAQTRVDTSRAALFRGQLAEARWQHGVARLHYDEALRLNPRDSWGHAEAARASLLLLELDAARGHLQANVKLTAAMNTLRRLSSNMSQSHIGQLIDEFALDQSALARLRNCLSLPPERQADALAQVVLDYPDVTAPATLYLIALRRSGWFDASVAQTTTTPQIPRRIAQFWIGAVPIGLEELMATWRSSHPDFEYRLFDDESAYEFLRSNYGTSVLQTYRRIREPAQCADLFRLAYLLHEGGFYVDSDDRCLNQIELFVPAASQLALYQENYGTIGNNFIGSVSGHPVIEQAFLKALAAINRGDSDLLWLSTGPGLLTRVFALHLAQLGLDMPAIGSQIHVMDLGVMHRLVGLHCPLPYKRSERHWSHTSFHRRSHRQS
jgi:tetratricopeptide (TPR) repeat protein